MSHNDAFTSYLLELLAPIGPVSARRMFGGTGLWHGATMFALIARDELFFKVGECNRGEYEESGQAPFTYSTKDGSRILTSYWSCPPELMDEPDALRDWARRAVEAARAAAKPKRRTTVKPRR